MLPDVCHKWHSQACLFVHLVAVWTESALYCQDVPSIKSDSISSPTKRTRWGVGTGVKTPNKRLLPFWVPKNCTEDWWCRPVLTTQTDQPHKWETCSTSNHSHGPAKPSENTFFNKAVKGGFLLTQGIPRERLLSFGILKIIWRGHGRSSLENRRK